MTPKTLEEGKSGRAAKPCGRCDGSGFEWRLPNGFSPFKAGGWNTMRAMYKVPCRNCCAKDSK